jgi:hypothetical protein
MNMFGSQGSASPSPQKPLKGKLAELGEDMVREFKPEDFGMSARLCQGVWSIGSDARL